MGSKLHLVGVGAHPDDVGFSVGGILANYVRRGHRATILNVTLGETVRPPGKAQREVMALRRKEGEEIARLLGAESAFLDVPGNTIIPTMEMKRKLVSALRKLQANIILYPTPWDTHADHRNLSWAMRDVIYYVGHAGIASDYPPCDLRSSFMYEIEISTNELVEPDLLFDISDVVDIKMKAVMNPRIPVFGKRGSRQALQQFRIWNEFWGMRGGVAFAEPLYQTFANMNLTGMMRGRKIITEIPMLYANDRRARRALR